MAPHHAHAVLPVFTNPLYRNESHMKTMKKKAQRREDVSDNKYLKED